MTDDEAIALFTWYKTLIDRVLKTRTHADALAHARTLRLHVQLDLHVISSSGDVFSFHVENENSNTTLNTLLSIPEHEGSHLASVLLARSGSELATRLSQAQSTLVSPSQEYTSESDVDQAEFDFDKLTLGPSDD